MGIPLYRSTPVPQVSDEARALSAIEEQLDEIRTYLAPRFVTLSSRGCSFVIDARQVFCIERELRTTQVLVYCKGHREPWRPDGTIAEICKKLGVPAPEVPNGI